MTAIDELQAAITAVADRAGASIVGIGSTPARVAASSSPTAAS